MLSNMNADATNPRAMGLNGAVVRQIKAERAASGMSVAELAEGAGISERSLARYMGFERDISLGLLDRLALTLGIDARTLMERAEERME